MTTEKQAAYIHQLIEEHKPENMDWWNREITGTSPLDIELGIRHDQATKKTWICGILNIDRRARRKLSFENAVAQYHAYLENLERQSREPMSTAEASKMIDELKAAFR
jgi:hypothetical protein